MTCVTEPRVEVEVDAAGGGNSKTLPMVSSTPSDARSNRVADGDERFGEGKRGEDLSSTRVDASESRLSTRGRLCFLRFPLASSAASPVASPPSYYQKI